MKNINCKINLIRRGIILILAITALLAVAVIPVGAANTVNSAYRTPITGYIQATNNKTARAYSSVNGTAVGWIYSTDDCRILEVYTNGWCKVIVPWAGYSSGRTVYTQLTNFFAAVGTSTKTVTVKSAAYSRSNLSTRLGYAYVNDKCVILAESGSYYQCLCPWDNGTQRLVWVAKSAFAAPAHVTVSAFNPVWPCASTSNYVSTMYRYWNGGNILNHGCRSNIYNAIDICRPDGRSGDAIYAIESGVVVEKGYTGATTGFGHYIVIEHSNGLRSLYGHLREASSLSKGAKVTRGQVIGYMGSTGNSSGPHLHFEMYYPNSFSSVVDPFATYYKGKVNVTVGGNSYRANSPYTSSDSRAQTWCSWLLNSCKKNGSGDYVFSK